MMKMKIEVFGTGCAKCTNTKALIREVLEKHGKDAEIIEISSMEEIISREVYMTPAVAIDGELKISGRVPTEDEVKKMLGL